MIRDAAVAITRAAEVLPAAADPEIPSDVVAPLIAYRITLRDPEIQAEVPGMLKEPAALILEFPTDGTTSDDSTNRLLSVFK
jgi:hypothetical protein